MQGQGGPQYQVVRHEVVRHEVRHELRHELLAALLEAIYALATPGSVCSAALAREVDQARRRLRCMQEVLRPAGVRTTTMSPLLRGGQRARPCS